MVVLDQGDYDLGYAIRRRAKGRMDEFAHLADFW